jgi:hypothetical protein
VLKGGAVRPVKSLFAGIVVGLMARDPSLLSAALLTLLLAVVLYLWDLFRLVAQGEVWVPTNADWAVDRLRVSP